MKNRYLREFMDENWLPSPIRMTVRDTLDVMLEKPFRPYYSDVVKKALELIQQKSIRRVAELGAGAAPISRRLATSHDLPKSVKLSPSDIYPDTLSWSELERQFPGVIECISHPVDFTKPLEFSAATLLILSATFHHVPFYLRETLLKNLVSHNVLVCEPIRRNWFSFILAILGFLPALLAPLVLIKRAGRFRRFLWCWLIPVTPFLIVWDGIASCFRCWTEQEWNTHLNKIAPSLKIQIEHSPVTTSISW